MSWVSHDVEPYPILKHTRWKIAFVPLLLGSYGPDLMTKWFVYGVHLGSLDLKARDPVRFHRGWPGMGFTHSLAFGVLMCFVFWKLLGSRNWGISFMIGQWAHAITDACDSVGTMLLFPWTQHFHLGLWRYSASLGRAIDAAAYFSGPGCMWDVFWILYGLLSWQVLTRAYFERHVFPADALWSKLNRLLPLSALLVLYRAAFFYGVSRWVAWTIWVHVIHHYPYDLTWGGPHWVSQLQR